MVMSPARSALRARRATRHDHASRFVAILLLPFMAACGGGDGGGAGSGGAEAGAAAGAPPTAGVPAFDACAVLAEVDGRAILGVATDLPMSVMQIADDRRAVSQCVIASTDGMRSVSLLLRHSSAEQVPTTREALVAQERGANVLGMGDESAQALAAAQEVAGLGDLALFYELISRNLAVFWNRHNTMIVSVSIDDPATALRHARSIAERVLARY